MNRTLLTIAGTLGFSAVLLGAFGAHGLRDKVAPPLLEIYRTGVLYHLVHAVVVRLLGAVHARPVGSARNRQHGFVAAVAGRTEKTRRRHAERGPFRTANLRLQ